MGGVPVTVSKLLSCVLSSAFLLTPTIDELSATSVRSGDSIDVISSLPVDFVGVAGAVYSGVPDLLPNAAADSSARSFEARVVERAISA